MPGIAIGAGLVGGNLASGTSSGGGNTLYDSSAFGKYTSKVGWDNAFGTGPSGNEIVQSVTGYDKAISAAGQPAAMRDPYSEGQAMLGAQTGTAQGQYNAYAQYNPLYAGIDSATANQQFGASATMYGQYDPYINALNNASNTAYQQAMIQGVDQYGQQVLGQYQALNPQLYASLGALSTSANQPLTTAGGTQASQLEQMLGQSAQQQLGLGSSLSAAEQRDATQTARAASNARGLMDSNSTIGAEILNNYNLANQRLQQRQQFAGDTAQLLRSGQQQDAGLAQQQFGNLATATNAWQQSRFDPYSSILGQQSGNQLNSMGIASLNAQTNAYNQQATRAQFDPYSSYATSIYGGNQQAQNMQQTNYANMLGQYSQQLLGMGPSLISALI